MLIIIIIIIIIIYDILIITFLSRLKVCIKIVSGT